MRCLTRMTTKDLSVRSREGLTSHDLVSAYHGSSRPETSTGHNAHERPSSALGGLQPRLHRPAPG